MIILREYELRLSLGAPESNRVRYSSDVADPVALVGSVRAVMWGTAGNYPKVAAAIDPANRTSP